MQLSPPFIRLAEHATALCAWCPRCLPGRRKPDVLRPGILGICSYDCSYALNEYNPPPQPSPPHQVSSTLPSPGQCRGFSRSRGGERAQRARRHYTCDMKAGGGRGEGSIISSAATKAVTAGLLGLQLLGMPFAVVGRQATRSAGANLPGLGVVVAEAGAKAPLTTEEEMIGEPCRPRQRGSQQIK